MGTRYNEKKKCWEAFYAKRHPITRVPKSLRRSNLKSKAEARRVEEQLILKINDVFNLQKTPLWKNVVAQFVQHSKDVGLGLKTVENRRLCLNAHTMNEWGERQISKIESLEIRKLVNEKLVHRSASQKKNVLKYIRLAFDYAVDQGMLDRNPTPRMKFKINDKIKLVLNEEQIKKFLSVAKEMDIEWYPIWATALYTGMRNGELYALTWDKVDLKRRQIKVDCAWNPLDGYKSTKSGDDRLIEIAPGLLPIFEKLKEQKDSVFVLPRIDAWDKREQARELRMFLLGLGLPAVRFHDLRASWATIMLSKGIAPIKVMKMGGWKDIKTMAIYTRLAGIDIEGITDSLDF